MNNVETWVAVALCLLLAITLIALIREKRLRRLREADIEHMGAACSRQQNEWMHMQLDVQRLLEVIEESSEGSVTDQINSIRYVIKAIYKRRPEVFLEEFELFQKLESIEHYMCKVSHVAINARPSTWKESDYIEEENFDPEILKILVEIRSILASRFATA